MVTKDYPASADEHSYLLSAKLFSEGKLYVDSPKSARLFNYYHIVNDGRFYGKYLPGWPFFLSFAVRFGEPMLANLFFGVATVLISFLIAKKLFSEIAGYITAILMSVSPYTMLFSASYFSHSMSLFFLALSTLIFIYSLEDGKQKYLILCGVCIGVIFNTRIFDAMLYAGLLLLIIFLSDYCRQLTSNHRYLASIKNYSWKLSFLFLGFLPFFLIFLLYNYLLTGNPLNSPYLLPYKITEFTNLSILGFTNDSIGDVFRVMKSNIIMLWNIAPILLVVPVICLLIVEKTKRIAFYGLGSIFVVFLIAHSFYWSGGSTYLQGRYLYASSFALYALAGYSFSRLYELKKPLGIILISIFAFSSLIISSDNFYKFNSSAESNSDVNDLVASSIHNNSIVFFDFNVPHGIHIMSAKQYLNYAIELDSNEIIFSNFRYYFDEDALKKSKLYPGRSIFAFECLKTKVEAGSDYTPINVMTGEVYCRVRYIDRIA